MKKISKKSRKIICCSDKYVEYDILDGLLLLQKNSRTKFIESVDVAVNLGIDSRKSDQNIRSCVLMPHGIGRNIRIAVFTQGDNIILAKQAGADLVGLEDLYEKVKKDGCINCDIVLASPDVMDIVGKLGPILGPKGLMPNPKMGTISNNIKESVQRIKLGQIRYKNDKGGVVHSIIGKINFKLIHLRENLEALISSINQVRPIQFKGTYIKKIFLSTTMGRSVLIDKNSLKV